MLDRLSAVACAALEWSETIGEPAWYSPDELVELGKIEFGGIKDVQAIDASDAALIAACDPRTILALVGVAKAAKQYYEHYAQDEADDGEHARDGKERGYTTGCSYEQSIDALALREALTTLRAAKGQA